MAASGAVLVLTFLGLVHIVAEVLIVQEPSPIAGRSGSENLPLMTFSSRVRVSNSDRPPNKIVEATFSVDPGGVRTSSVPRGHRRRWEMCSSASASHSSCGIHRPKIAAPYAHKPTRRDPEAAPPIQELSAPVRESSTRDPREKPRKCQARGCGGVRTDSIGGQPAENARFLRIFAAGDTVNRVDMILVPT